MWAAPRTIPQTEERGRTPRPAFRLPYSGAIWLVAQVSHGYNQDYQIVTTKICQKGLSSGPSRVQTAGAPPKKSRKKPKTRPSPNVARLRSPGPRRGPGLRGCPDPGLALGASTITTYCLWAFWYLKGSSANKNSMPIKDF